MSLSFTTREMQVVECCWCVWCRTTMLIVVTRRRWKLSAALSAQACTVNLFLAPEFELTSQGS